MLKDPREPLSRAMDAAEEALQKATAELHALPDDSPLIITTALKMHQANATYLTGSVALLSYDLVAARRELNSLRERVAALEAKRAG